MDETKVICDCGHSAEEHSYDNGCEWSEHHVFCKCPKTKEALIIEYLEKQISSLETDLIQARRVADERQAEIEGQRDIIVAMRNTSIELEKERDEYKLALMDIEGFSSSDSKAYLTATKILYGDSDG